MKKAFTMIELIFVIVILGILASVAIPRLAATRADAEISAALANIRTFIGDAAAFYTARGDFTNPDGNETNVVYETFTNVPFYYRDVDTDGSHPVNFVPDNHTKVNTGRTGLQVQLRTGSRKEYCLGMEFGGSNGWSNSDVLLNGGKSSQNQKGLPLIMWFDVNASNKSTVCEAIKNSQEIKNYVENEVTVIEKTFDNSGNIKETPRKFTGAILVGQSASIYGQPEQIATNP